MLPRANVVLATLLLAAGCLAPNDNPDGFAVPPGPPERALHRALLPLAERVLASEPGHRFSEFSLARDPTAGERLILAAIDWDDPAGGSSCAVSVSDDGGRSWTSGIRPFPKTLRSQGDPWVDVDTEGNAHMMCIDVVGDGGTLKQFPIYARSVDGGRTWGTPIRLPMAKPGDTTDKGALGVDGHGGVFACIADFNANALVVTRSLDGGTTWEAATPATDLLATCNGVEDGPDGAVYVLFSARGGRVPADAMGTIRSDDRGRTWEPAVVAAVPNRDKMPSEAQRVVPTKEQLFFPSLAVSPRTGTVFIAYQDLGPDGHHHVRLARSTDRGDSYTLLPDAGWELALPTCADCDFTRPLIAVDQHGVLALQWVRAGAAGATQDVWMSTSADEGVSWAEPLVLGSTDLLTSRYHPRTVTPAVEAESVGHIGDAARSPVGMDTAWTAFGAAYAAPFFSVAHSQGGEYWGIASTENGFVASWIDRGGEGVPGVWTRPVRLL